MVSKYMEDTMSVDTVFAAAVERLAQEQNKELKELVHNTMKLSTPDVSLREFKRIYRPDKQGRHRSLTLREAYEFSRAFGKTIDEMIALGLLES